MSLVLLVGIYFKTIIQVFSTKTYRNVFVVLQYLFCNQNFSSAGQLPYIHHKICAKNINMI